MFLFYLSLMVSATPEVTATWDKRYLWALLPLSVAIGLIVYALLCTQSEEDSKEDHKESRARNRGSMDAPMEGPLQPQGDATGNDASPPAAGLLRRLSSTTSGCRERAHTAQEPLPCAVDLKRSSKKSRTSHPVTHQPRRSSATEQTARRPHRNPDARSHHVDPTQRRSASKQALRHSEDSEQFSSPHPGSKARRSKQREMLPFAL